MANALKDDGLFTWSRKPVEKFVKGLNSGDGPYQDPTALGFQFLFDYIDVAGSPLLVDVEDTPGTALAYLKSIGETQRVLYLKQFIDLLRKINKDSPWYWQSIEGIKEAMEQKMWEGGGKSGFMGGPDKPIKITTLESIDLKITALMDLYRHAAFDMKNRRAILPENLRKFRVYIWISEVRKIKIPSLDKVESADLGNVQGGEVSSEVDPNASPSAATTIKSEDQKKTSSFQENLPFIFLKFDFCEWDMDGGHGPLESLTFAGPEFAANQITFTWGDVSQPASMFMPQLLDLMVGDSAGSSAPTGQQGAVTDDDTEGTLAGSGVGGNAFGKTDNSFLDKVKDRIKDKLALGVFSDLPSPKQLLETGVQNLTETGIDLLTGYLNGLLLGNVYELNLTDLRSTLEGMSTNSLLQNVKDKLGLSEQGTSGGGPALGDNVYDGAQLNISGVPPQERLFDPAQGPTNLDVGDAQSLSNDINTFADSAAAPSEILGLERLFIDESGIAPLSQENILPDEDGSEDLSAENILPESDGSGTLSGGNVFEKQFLIP